MENLKGMTIAILVEDGFEQVELSRPRIALDLAGAATRIVSPRREHVRAWNFKNWGEEFAVDIVLTRAQPSDFHALLLTQSNQLFNWSYHSQRFEKVSERSRHMLGLDHLTCR